MVVGGRAMRALRLAYLKKIAKPSTARRVVGPIKGLWCMNKDINCGVRAVVVTGSASEIYNRHKTEIREIASRYPVSNIRLFGSVLHSEDKDSSDIDLLVDTLPEAALFDLEGLQDELQALLGVQVDLVTPGDLSSRFRASIISEAKPV